MKDQGILPPPLSPPSLPRSTGHHVAAFLRVALSPKFLNRHVLSCAYMRSFWPDPGRIHENVDIRFIKLTKHSKKSCLKCLCLQCFKLVMVMTNLKTDIFLSFFFFLQFIVKDRISALDAMKHDYFFCLGKHVQELKNSKLCNIPKFQELSTRPTKLDSSLSLTFTGM